MSRVLVDTNVIVSALIFPNSTPARALSAAINTDRIVLTDWILDELHDVIGRKWSDRLPALNSFSEQSTTNYCRSGHPESRFETRTTSPFSMRRSRARST